MTETRYFKKHIKRAENIVDMLHTTYILQHCRHTVVTASNSHLDVSYIMVRMVRIWGWTLLMASKILFNAPIKEIYKLKKRVEKGIFSDNYHT